jgi:hypothetical protein
VIAVAQDRRDIGIDTVGRIGVAFIVAVTDWETGSSHSRVTVGIGCSCSAIACSSIVQAKYTLRTAINTATSSQTLRDT